MCRMIAILFVWKVFFLEDSHVRYVCPPSVKSIFAGNLKCKYWTHSNAITPQKFNWPSLTVTIFVLSNFCCEKLLTI